MIMRYKLMLYIRSHKERTVEPLNPAVTGLSSFNKCASVELSSWKYSLNHTQMNGSLQVYTACYNHSDFFFLSVLITSASCKNVVRSSVAQQNFILFFIISDFYCLFQILIKYNIIP